MYSISTESARYRLVSYHHGTSWHPSMPDVSLPENLPQCSTPSWVTGADYRDLTGSISQRFGDHMQATRLGLSYRPKFSGVVGYLAANQSTLRDMLTCLCRHSGFLMRGAQFDLVECDRIATLSYSVGAGDDAFAFDVEMTLAALVRLLRDRTDGSVQIRQINFGHRPHGSVSDLRGLLQARVVTGQETNSIVFDAATLDIELADTDPELRAGLEKLMALAGILPEEDSLLTRARAKIADGLCDRNFGITSLSASLCMTPRTLQRHLTAAGQTFSGLRDQVRKDRAMAMLSHTDLPIGEISYRLGFTEVSSFYRSFRQWTDLAPGAFRRQSRPGMTQQVLEAAE